MPYVSIGYYYPIQGREQELGAQLTELVQTAQAQGIRASVSQQLFGPEGAAFTGAHFPNTLADVEQVIQRAQTDQTLREAVAKAIALCRTPVRRELWETLVPRQDDRPQGFRWTARFSPALGKTMLLQRHLTEWVQHEQTKGLVCSLNNRLFAPRPETSISTWYSNLAHLEETRKRFNADQDFQAALAEAIALSDAPISSALYAVIVPPR